VANLTSGSMSALNETVDASPLDNFGTAGIIIEGTWTGTISFEGSLDGTTFVPIFVQEISGTKLSISTTVNAQFLANTSGMFAIRARMSSFTSGTADVTMQANASPFLQRSLSTLAGDTDGTLIGNDDDSLKVSGLVLADEGGLEVKPELSHQAYLDAMKCLQEEILAQLKIMNTHLSCVSDLEDVENRSSEDGAT
jgi:hypothetical protein